MKRSRKTLFALLLALVMTLGLAATAWATGVNENDGQLVVTPGEVLVVENNVTCEIPFTKTVKLGGNTAPGKETFTFEAVPRTDNGDAVYPDVQRSVKIETNGVGTYQGTLTITGPAEQVENFVGRGFYIHEVRGTDQRWKYSEEEYLVAFDIDNATQEPMLKFYRNNEKEVSEITFENIYTYSTTPIRREKPNTPEPAITAPKTFDAGVALYGVSALLSLTGAALVIKRKNG